MTNLELAKEQGNQAAPNIIDAARASEVQIDVTLAQEQGNQAAPLLADSLASSESYDAIKQQGNQAMPLIVDALESPSEPVDYFSMEATQVGGGPGVVDFAIYTIGINEPQQLNLEYSLDNGDSWLPFEFSDFDTTNGIKVSNVIGFMTEGEKALLRGNNTGLGTSVEQSVRILGHSGGGTFRLGGDIRTLTDGNKPAGPMKPMAYLFSDFFGFDVHLGGDFNPDGSTLTLPEVLTEFCCKGMFRSSDILVPPALPAETLACQCYDEMFTDTLFTASDDGETFNFTVGVTFPQTDPCGVYFANAKRLAEHMGLFNNGFNIE